MKHTTTCAVLHLLWTLLAASAQADRVALVAGGGTEGPGGRATNARLNGPFSTAAGPGGTLYIAEMPGNRICSVDRKGVLQAFAGDGEKGDRGDGGPANRARFNGIHHIVVAPGGTLYVADTFNNRVRKIDLRTGNVTAFLGTGQKGFAGDGGKASDAFCGGIYSLALDAGAENLYAADLDNRRIRRVHLSTGIVDTVAGNGERGVPTDGADACATPLVDPRAVAVDRNGNIYILERSGNAVRAVDRALHIRTVVGTGRPGPVTDTCPAREATLRSPKHLCIDRDGGVLIADSDNHSIRKYLPREERVVRIAGTGTAGAGGVGGAPDKLHLNQPHGVYVDPAGVLYIADSTNNRVLKIVR